MKKIVIATRGSALALWQAEHVRARLEARAAELGHELPTCPHCHSANTEKLLSRPCACRREGGDSGGGCSGCSGGSCASCGH